MGSTDLTGEYAILAQDFLSFFSFLSTFFFFSFFNVSFSFFLAKLKMAIGNCTKCGKAIVRAANLTEYKGAKYHSSCFKCTGCGNDITGPEGFINHQEQLYCHACYDKDVAEKCQKCNKSLADGGIRFQDHAYHKECFLCNGCGSTLGEGKFFTNADQPFCPDCHTNKYAERCSLDSCGKPIPPGSQYVEIEANKYHKNCFRCSNCNKVISDQPFVKDEDGNFCADCADSWETRRTLIQSGRPWTQFGELQLSSRGYEHFCVWIRWKTPKRVFRSKVVYTYSDTAFSMTSFDQRLSLKRYPFIATAFIFGPISMGIVSYSAAIPILCRTRYF